MWSQGLCEVSEDSDNSEDMSFQDMKQLVCQRVVREHLWPPLFFTKVRSSLDSILSSAIHTTKLPTSNCPPVAANFGVPLDPPPLGGDVKTGDHGPAAIILRKQPTTAAMQASFSCTKQACLRYCLRAIGNLAPNIRGFF